MKKKNDESKSKHEGNVYDRIFKENAESLFIPIIESELDIKIKRYKILPEKLPKTVEREVDFLYEIELEDGTIELLHLEFQTENDNKMIYRIGFYHGLAWFKYQKPIRHVVIYLGKGKPKMRTQLTDDEVFSGFDLINVYQLNTETLLSSQVPEVILLAFLSDFEPERREAILRLTINRLKDSSKSKSELSKYMEQLIILARLRNFGKETIKIIRDMPVLYDVETDYLYIEGREKGAEDFVIRALEKGKSYDEIIDFTGLTFEEIEIIDTKRKTTN